MYCEKRPTYQHTTPAQSCREWRQQSPQRRWIWWSHLGPWIRREHLTLIALQDFQKGRCRGSAQFLEPASELASVLLEPPPLQKEMYVLQKETYVLQKMTTALREGTYIS